MDMTEISEARPDIRGAAMTCAKLVAWVTAAQPNARAPYGYGSNASQACSTPVREKVLELYEAGYLTPHRIKVSGEPVHIVQRTAKPVLKGAKL